MACVSKAEREEDGGILVRGGGKDAMTRARSFVCVFVLEPLVRLWELKLEQTILYLFSLDGVGAIERHITCRVSTCRVVIHRAGFLFWMCLLSVR